MFSFPAHPETKKKLVNLLNGDNDVCQRLINKIKIKSPDLNEQQCWEKAIEDLIRDRR